MARFIDDIQGPPVGLPPKNVALASISANVGDCLSGSQFSAFEEWFGLDVQHGVQER